MKACCSVFSYESPEVAGWLKLISSRAMLAIVSTLYAATALVFISRQLDTDCDERISIGFMTLDVASILAVASFAENLCNALISPLWGTLADTKTSRKSLIIASSGIWVGCSVFIGLVLLYAYAEDYSYVLLYFIFVPLVLSSIFYELFLLLMYAYLPELADSDELLSELSSRSEALTDSFRAIGAILLIALGIGLDSLFRNELPMAAIAHFSIAACFFVLGVPGLRKLPHRTVLATKLLNDAENQGKKHTFMGSLRETMKEVTKSYPQIRSFLLAYLFTYSALTGVVVLEIIHLQDELGFSVTAIAAVGALLLIFSIAGAFLSERLLKKYSRKQLYIGSLLVCVLFSVLTPLLAVAKERDEVEVVEEEVGLNCTLETVYEEEPTTAGLISVFVLVAMIGVAFGMLIPVSTGMYSELIPGGKEASYFGLKTFTSKAIGWIPPLLTAVVIEASGDSRLAYLVFVVWFAAPIPFIFSINMDKGKDIVKHTLSLREVPAKPVEIKDDKRGL